MQRSRTTSASLPPISPSAVAAAKRTSFEESNFKTWTKAGTARGSPSLPSSRAPSRRLLEWRLCSLEAAKATGSSGDACAGAAAEPPGLPGPAGPTGPGPGYSSRTHSRPRSEGNRDQGRRHEPEREVGRGSRYHQDFAAEVHRRSGPKTTSTEPRSEPALNRQVPPKGATRPLDLQLTLVITWPALHVELALNAASAWTRNGAIALTLDHLGGCIRCCPTTRTN